MDNRFGNYGWIPDNLSGIYDAVIFAGGPSLAEYEPPRKPGDPHSQIWSEFLERWTGMYRIFISHASKFVSPEYIKALVFLDGSVQNTLKQDFQKMPYRTVVGQNINLDPEGKVTRIKYASEPQIDPAKGFFGSFSSGYFALNLALAMNPKRIFLLGFDCCAPGGPNAVNFYDTKQTKGYRHGEPHKYENMAHGSESHKARGGLQGFDKFRPWADKIFNLSQISTIKTFKKIKLDNEKK